MKVKKECGKSMEVYSRVVGYYRPVQNWNAGKREEFRNRKPYKIYKSLGLEKKSDDCQEKSLFTL